jgi:hypothetical protein
LQAHWCYTEATANSTLKCATAASDTLFKACVGVHQPAYMIGSEWPHKAVLKALDGNTRLMTEVPMKAAFCYCLEAQGVEEEVQRM